MDDVCLKCETKRVTLENGDRVLENPSGRACNKCYKWAEEQFNEQERSNFQNNRPN